MLPQSINFLMRVTPIRNRATRRFKAVPWERRVEPNRREYAFSKHPAQLNWQKAKKKRRKKNRCPGTIATKTRHFLDISFKIFSYVGTNSCKMSSLLGINVTIGFSLTLFLGFRDPNSVCCENNNNLKIYLFMNIKHFILPSFKTICR